MKKGVNKGLKILLSLGFSFVLFAASLSTVSAATGGYWFSGMYRDLNGVSEVGTTYSGGAGSSIRVDMSIKYSDHDVVGWKTASVLENGSVSHISWGLVGWSRYGEVITPASAYHTPWFNA